MQGEELRKAGVRCRRAGVWRHTDHWSLVECGHTRWRRTQIAMISEPYESTRMPIPRSIVNAHVDCSTRTLAQSAPGMPLRMSPRVAHGGMSLAR